MNENLKCMLQAIGFWCFAAFFVSLIATIIIHPESIVGICLSFTFFPIGDCGAWVKDIVPIPLTPKILEKNGWKLSHGFYLSPNEEGAEVGLSSQTGYVWEAYIRRHPFRSNINSVSDLQHLLFGLGINSEMEV